MIFFLLNNEIGSGNLFLVRNWMNTFLSELIRNAGQNRWTFLDPESGCHYDNHSNRKFSSDNLQMTAVYDT